MTLEQNERRAIRIVVLASGMRRAMLCRFLHEGAFIVDSQPTDTAYRDAAKAPGARTVIVIDRASYRLNAESSLDMDRLTSTPIITIGNPPEINEGIPRTMRVFDDFVSEHSLTPGELRFRIRQCLERCTHQMSLLRRATTDALTGAASRAQFHSVLNSAICERHGRSGLLCVAMVDVDNFKSTNDRFGHVIGDQLLRILAERLQSCTRDQDTVGRIGGDEFAVVVPGLEDDRAAMAVGERIVRSLREPVTIQGLQLEASVSVGIAFSEADSTTDVTQAEALLQAADEAMYKAKAEGKNGVRVFRAMGDVWSEERAEAAMSYERLNFRYQGLFDRSSRQPCAFEALLRPDDAAQRPLPVEEVIARMQREHDPDRLFELLVGNVVEEFSLWSQIELYPGNLALNVSHAQLASCGFHRSLANCVEQCDFPAERLELHVRGVGLMQSSPSACLDALREMGCRVFIEDLELEPKVMDALRWVHAAGFHLGKTLVGRCAESSRERALAAALLRMGRELGLMTTCKGLESPRQLTLAENMGPDRLQGNLLAPAVALTELSSSVRGQVG